MSDDDLIRRGDAKALCDKYDYPEGVKYWLDDVPAVTPAVKVKPLVWHDHMDGKSHDGSAHDDENLYEIDMQDGMYRLSVATVIGGAYISHYRSLDAAKATAQGHYEVRILSALDVTPAPTLADALEVPEVKALLEAAKALRADMLDRSITKMDTIHGEVYRIVNAGRTAWAEFDAALRRIAEGGT